MELLVRNVVARVFFILILSLGLRAEEPPTHSSLWGDMKQSFEYLYKASYTQFTLRNNLYYAAAATPALWYSFEEDKRITSFATRGELPKYAEIIGDLGVAFNFPLIPMGFYFWGEKSGSNKHKQFAMEYAATLYLTLLESAFMSYIDVHQRPNQGELSFWEEAFRGDSSFPSGHVVPYATLFFKTLQFYGPWWSLPALVLTGISSYQRIQEGRHFTSDVVGAFFLTAFASEGVRAVAKYKDNHPFYKWLFERDLKVGAYQREGALAPYVSWSF